MDQTINHSRKLNMLDGFKAGLPIFLGYFPVAMAFGILAKGTGLKLYETLAFSFIVFAGAAQFIAVSMIALGSSAMEIVVTTLFLNFRHFLMSASLAPKIEIDNPLLKPVISFFITDESFSLASFAEGELTSKYMMPMELTGYLGWGLGTGIGYIVGSILPPLLQQSMGIGLYAMFVALLVPEMKKTPKAILLAVISGFVNSILVKGFHLQQGWSIVITIIIVSALGVFIYGNELENKTKETMEELDYE